LREFLAGQTRILDLIDFGDAPVFDAIAYPSIILAQRATPDSHHQLRAFTWSPGSDIAEFPALCHQHRFVVPQAGLRPDGWQLERKEVLALSDKLRAGGKPLREYVQGRFYRGILTGLNEAFVVDRATRDRLISEHKSSAEVLKPFLRGRDVKRWRCAFADQYLIKIESSENKAHPWSGKPQAKAEAVFKQTYPAIHKFMDQFRDALVKRADQGKYFWELRSCIYWEEFESLKIVIPAITDKCNYALDEKGHFSNDKTSICVSEAPEYTLALLNSSVLWWFIRQVGRFWVHGGICH